MTIFALSKKGFPVFIPGKYKRIITIYME